MNEPNATVTSVQRILQAYNGYGQPPRHVKTSWLVSLPDGDATESALMLINMLRGWTAEPHPGMQNMIRIQTS